MTTTLTWTLDVVPAPVTDVDRAKRFHADRVGFVEDLDNVGFLFVDDPDGNGWAVQQISARAAAGNATA